MSETNSCQFVCFIQHQCADDCVKPRPFHSDVPNDYSSVTTRAFRQTQKRSAQSIANEFIYPQITNYDHKKAAIIIYQKETFTIWLLCMTNPASTWLCVGFFNLVVINDLIHNILKAFFFFQFESFYLCCSFSFTNTTGNTEMPFMSLDRSISSLE